MSVKVQVLLKVIGVLLLLCSEASSSESRAWPRRSAVTVVPCFHNGSLVEDNNSESDAGVLEVLVLSLSASSLRIQSYWRKTKGENKSAPFGPNEVLGQIRTTAKGFGSRVFEIPSLDFCFQICNGADLAIQIPVTDFQDPNGMYRLDYTPPVGFPLPNTTFRAVDISSAINFSDGLPGTKYNFRVYYTNNTIHDWLTWTASITTSKGLGIICETEFGTEQGIQWNYLLLFPLFH